MATLLFLFARRAMVKVGRFRVNPVTIADVDRLPV
jgi:hypothetical protein